MKNSTLLTRFFAVAALAGFVSLAMLVSFSPDPQTSWILGFSRNRIIMLSVILIGITFFIGLMIKAKRDTAWADRFVKYVEVHLKKDKFRISLLCLLIIIFIGGFIFIYSANVHVDYVIRPQMLVMFELMRTYMQRLTPFVIWGMMLSFQSLFTFSYLGLSNRKDYYQVARIISLLLFPALLLVFWLLNRSDPDFYYYINKEDQLVEWLTFACLIITGLLSLKIAIKAYQNGSRFLWFYLIFGIACIILGFEEISWGQRVFQIESSEFFLENSDQQEINVHNVINLWFSVRTKHVAAFVLFIYGVVFPLLALNPKIKTFFQKIYLIVPPLFLILGFSLGAFLTLDIFSGKEEEVAEFFLSLSLLLFIILENLKSDHFQNKIKEPIDQPI